MNNQPISSSDGSEDQETKKKIINKWHTSHWLCLVTSLIVQGMIMSTEIVNSYEQKEAKALYRVPIILSVLLVLLQFFSSNLLVWLRCRFIKTLLVLIAVVSNLMQIAILIFACINSHEHLKIGYLTTACMNVLFVCLWTCTLVKMSDYFDEYFERAESIRNIIEFPYPNILMLSLIATKQTFIGMQSMMLQLQNPFSSDYRNALYFILIFMHLLFDFLLISMLAILGTLHWVRFIYKKSIVSGLLNLITFIAFIIISNVGRSELSSIQIAIWLILIAMYFLEFGNSIIRKAFASP
ncbi:MAG: hypothetical protein MHMPM18_005183 [Marteilia pararefringens]